MGCYRRRQTISLPGCASQIHSGPFYPRAELALLAQEMTPGTKVGPYEITAAIGAGGMGEVYRAHDPKLGRDVAIKVLPEAFARDAERMARFQREAKVLASLNHPNIATIYGLEDSGSTRALVMELVEGPTLADRIKTGPIPVDEAVRIARQIADALEYAHERGIIHRDLKPANIKVAADDTVKVLDFGLAKAIEGDPSSIDISTSPTISRMATQQGVLLGTAAYMSPEQAKGKPVDRRADIWAFGCVLYEMLTGKVAFPGDSVTDTLAGVIRAEPDWSLLPSSTPMRVRVLLQRCLQKDRKERLQAIGDARIALNEVLSGAPDLAPVVGAQAAAVPLWRGTLPWLLFGVTAVALAALSLVHFREKPPAPAPTLPVQRYEFAAPDPSLTSVGALSPDGTRWVLLSRAAGSGPRLWLRRMDSSEAHPLAGTEGANEPPFWSPDSRFIAFGTQDHKLKKMDTDGGPAQVLCDAGPYVVGGFWTQDGKIVFADPERQPGLFVVPAAGGVSSPLPDVEHGNPDLYSAAPLPDGKHFLYVSGGPASGDLYLGSLDSKAGKQSSKKLITGTMKAVYVPLPDDSDLGYLLFVRGTGTNAQTGTLMAQPFDVRKLGLEGEPVPIAEQVPAGFSASSTGTLIYVSASPAGPGQLTLFDRQGKILGTVGEPGVYTWAAFSPDGRRVVTARGDSQSGSENLWMIDLARGISTRFTFNSGTDFLPVWSPDGTRIAFGSTRSGKYDLYEKLSNGGSDEQLLLKSESETGVTVPLSWSGDGRFLLFGATSSDALVLPLDPNGHASGKPFLFVQKGIGTDPHFSPGPQGHPLWIAYASNESGRYEIYVRPFDPNSPTGTPTGGGKWQVSTQGGLSPRWNSNGKELFYVAPDGTVTSVDVSGSTVFQSGVPKPLFTPKGLVPQSTAYFYWDASSDGKKFIFPVLSAFASAAAPPTKFTVVLNWTSLLKK
jgi:eukaryotic-like serine/threonine-protein kinase